jgi:hypothetical protein
MFKEVRRGFPLRKRKKTFLPRQYLPTRPKRQWTTAATRIREQQEQIGDHADTTGGAECRTPQRGHDTEMRRVGC